MTNLPVMAPITQRVSQEVAPRQQLRVAIPIAVTPVGLANTTIYTAPTDADFVIERLYAVNVSGSAVTVDLFLVSSGGSPAAGNQVVNGATLTAARVPDLVLQDLRIAPGTAIVATCSSANDANIFGSGYTFAGEYA